MLEKTLESPLDCKEIQPVHPKGDKSRVFIGRTIVEAKIPILWPSDVKSWLIGKDPDVGKDWRQEEKGTTRLDGCMASPTQWTWVWVNSRSWWWTGRPGVLGAMRSQRVGHDWAIELNWRLVYVHLHVLYLYFCTRLVVYCFPAFYFLFVSFFVGGVFSSSVIFLWSLLLTT